MTNLRTIWWRIYPNGERHRWMPLIWLPFMVWFFVDPIVRHVGPLFLIGNTLFGLVFVLLYLYSFSRPEPRRLYTILAMIAMAAVAMPFNGGGVGLLVYASAAAGFTPNLRRALVLTVLLVAILGLFVQRHHLPVEFWGSMLLLIIVVGIGKPLRGGRRIARRQNCNWRRKRSNISPRSPSANALRVTCTICWDTHYRSSL